jgi:hypothetical protein
LQRTCSFYAIKKPPACAGSSVHPTKLRAALLLLAALLATLLSTLTGLLARLLVRLLVRLAGLVVALLAGIAESKYPDVKTKLFDLPILRFA